MLGYLFVVDFTCEWGVSAPPSVAYRLQTGASCAVTSGHAARCGMLYFHGGKRLREAMSGNGVILISFTKYRQKLSLNK